MTRAPDPTADAREKADDALAGLDRLRPREIAVAVPTYNNAATAKAVAEAIGGAAEGLLAGIPIVVLNVDAGSSDGTSDLLAGGHISVASYQACLVLNSSTADVSPDSISSL